MRWIEYCIVLCCISLEFGLSSPIPTRPHSHTATHNSQPIDDGGFIVDHDLLAAAGQHHSLQILGRSSSATKFNIHTTELDFENQAPDVKAIDVEKEVASTIGEKS